MPIRTVESSIRLPILGVIRLGEKKVSAKGSKYPTESEYFILKDAPEVAAVYGEEPKELDIMFPSDDENIIIPTWFKWYSAAKEGSNGEVIGGTLNCYGDGPDDSGNPGTALFVRQRDRITGVTPQRPCLGPNCLDWFNSRGQQQCKQSMQVLCMLPLVSMYGVFRINTSSWNAIRSVHGLIKWIKSMNGGVVKGIPLKLKRVERTVQYTDEKGTTQSRIHHIMELHQNDKFTETHGEEVLAKLQGTFKNNTLLLPTEQELLDAPSPLAYQLPPAAEIAEEKAKDRMEVAREIMVDPEFVAAMQKFEATVGRKLTEKEVLSGILKKCEEADWKGAVIAALMERVAQAESTPQKEEPTPQVDASDLT